MKRLFRKLFIWFERKLLKITYSIGADYNIYKYSSIAVIRINNRTGKMEVISMINDKNCPYRDFLYQLHALAKEYKTNDVFIDKPIGF